MLQQSTARGAPYDEAHMSISSRSEERATAIEVYADISCPFTHVGLRRFIAARDASGSGLGLAIVKALVTAHDGDISVVSALGSGTTFTIRLPAIAAEPAFALN